MADPEQEEIASPLEQLREALAGPHGALVRLLEDLHEADIAEAMLDLTERESWLVFDSLSIEGRAEVLSHAEDSVREQLLEQLTPRQIAMIVEEMPADDVVDLLSLAGPEATERVLLTVDFERARGLRELASHPPDTAGGQMTTEYLAVPRGTRLGDAIKLLKLEADEVEEGLGVFVVDDDRRPIGYVSDRMLLTNSIHSTVDEVMTEPFAVPTNLDQEEVARQVQHYGLNEIAVVDDSGALVGVVAADDAQEILEEEASEDILRMVGTSPELQTRLPILKRVVGRLPLQGVTVFGGLVTAEVIGLFMVDEPSATADLLRFLPIIIGLAGNVGIQASTILVRAFATGEVEPERELSVLGSETLVGLIIGLICGGATFGFVALTGDHESLGHAGAIGMAISSAVVWAAFLGCTVPMFCRRVGIDPAIVAGPFLITVSDISGTILFLVVANALFGLTS